MAFVDSSNGFWGLQVYSITCVLVGRGGWKKGDWWCVGLRNAISGEVNSKTEGSYHRTRNWATGQEGIKFSNCLLLSSIPFRPLRNSQGRMGSVYSPSLPAGCHEYEGLQKGKLGIWFRPLPGSSTLCRLLHCRSCRRLLFMKWAYWAHSANPIHLSPLGRWYCEWV